MHAFRPGHPTTAISLALIVGVAAAARAGAPGANSCALLDPALPAALTPASVPELDALPAAGGQPPVVQLPPVYVKGQRPAESDLKEEQPVGSANQPAWTATRRFPNVRIYTIPEHALETELWVVPQWNKDHTQEARTLFEVEYGFAKHWQLDLYFRLDQFPDDHRQHPGGQIEVRYALADWGQIWGNPTLYLEYAPLEDEPSTIEGKLLLGDTLAPRWHWGLNLSLEQQLSDQHATEYQFDFGLSYTIFDQFLSIGPEIRGDYANEDSSRGFFSNDLRLGPSMQIRPIPKMFINIAPLFGVSKDSGHMQLWLNVGFEF